MTHIAGRWLRANRSTITTWESFKKAFLARFGDSPEKLWVEYNNLRQGANEQVVDYTERLATVREKLEISDNCMVARARFVDCLRPKLRETVSSLRCSYSLADAAEYAAQLEDRLPDIYGPRRSTDPPISGNNYRRDDDRRDQDRRQGNYPRPVPPAGQAPQRWPTSRQGTGPGP
jgi:hypothetical protein